MATAPPLLSIEEYLRTSYHPDADYVDGEIEERNLGEFEHATFQSAINGWFWPRRHEWAIRPVTEQRIHIKSSRVRVCDIAILRADAPRKKVTQTPPLICIEIMSPEDRLSRAQAVLADYFATGVPNIWLIDPIHRTAFTFDAKGLQEANPTNLIVAGSPISLDLTEAFSAID